MNPQESREKLKLTGEYSLRERIDEAFQTIVTRCDHFDGDEAPVCNHCTSKVIDAAKTEFEAELEKRLSAYGEERARAARMDALREIMTALEDHPANIGIESAKIELQRLSMLPLKTEAPEAAQAWIPVSERLPEKNAHVWGWNKREKSGVLCLGSVLCENRFGDWTHWQPLPPAPGVEPT